MCIDNGAARSTDLENTHPTKFINALKHLPKITIEQCMLLNRIQGQYKFLRNGQKLLRGVFRCLEILNRFQTRSSARYCCGHTRVEFYSAVLQP